VCSIERPGSSVSGEGEAARLPATAARAHRRPRRYPGQRVRCPTQTGALRRGRHRAQRCLASSSCPASFRRWRLRRGHDPRAPACAGPGPAGWRPAARAARGGGSHPPQTALGHLPAADVGLPGGQHPAVQPHHQLCQVSTEPPRAQPVVPVLWNGATACKSSLDWSPDELNNRDSSIGSKVLVGWLVLGGTTCPVMVWSRDVTGHPC